jgi:hypothetical protein
VEERLRDYRRDVRRVYGDWVRPDISPWRNVAESAGYRLVQVTRLIKGKSSVDQRIAIDAMDILSQGRVGVICLATNDTDFVPLLHRLREGHLFTVLIGDQRAPSGLRTAAHEFHEFPTTLQTPLKTVATVVAPTLQDILPDLIATYDATARGGMANLAAFGTALKKRIPGFNAKDYGEKRLIDLLGKLPDTFVVLSENRGEHPPTHYLRRREG